MFDLVFTSPPFFDFEVYTDLPGQSIQGANNKLQTWLVNFLFVALSKAWDRLEPGGHIAIHITDVMSAKVRRHTRCHES